MPIICGIIEVDTKEVSDMIRRMLAILLTLALLCGTVLAEGAEDTKETVYTELSIGSKDAVGVWSVYSLQLQLKQLGYVENEPDGMYGSATANAVKAFQEDHGLTVTGVADPYTQEVLFATANGSSPVPVVTPDPNVVIAMGNASADVSIVQDYMYLWGFSQNLPDGTYGKSTQEDLVRFQDYTYNEMVAFTEARTTPEPTPTPSPTPDNGMPAIGDEIIVPETTIPSDGTVTRDWMTYIEQGFQPYFDPVGVGASGPEIRRMQRRLIALGYSASGVDGTFGKHTEVALTYFQQRNHLPETGVCDRQTQEVLFSHDAINSDKVVTLYKAMVSVRDQRVYIYRWTGNDYTALEHTFVCSTGTVANPTITGTFQAEGRNGEWYYMEDSCVWVKYAFVITGGFFFHSVLFNNQYDTTPTGTSVRNLGTRASHGCVRMAEADAKWIYDNCENGMTVVIYED